MARAKSTEVLHVYTRVSTSAQEDKGTSLVSQDKLGRDRARSLGFEVKVWNEGGKSSNHEEITGRPVLSALFNEVTSGSVKHIFVYDQSRLSRNDNVASLIRYQCKKNGVTLYTKDGQYDFTNPSDTLMKQILDAMAEFDNAGRAERTRLGKLHRVKQNNWYGGPPPFGYKIEDKKLVPEKREAAKVKEMFQRYAAGEPTHSIKKYMDKGGVLPRRGGLWSLGSIQRIFRNTHYIGYFGYQDKKSGEQVRLTCSPIIPNSLWESVRKKLDKALERRGQVNRTVHFFMLRDLLYCGFCNAPLGARSKSSKAEHFYYCPTKERRWRSGVEPVRKHSKKDGCGFARSMNIELTDKLVWSVVLDAHSKSSLLKEEVKKRLVGAIVEPDDGYDATAKKNEKAVKALQKEVLRADEAIAELDVEHRLRQVDDKQYAMVMKRLQEQRSAKLAQIEVLKEGVKNQALERKWVDWVKAFGDEVKLKGSLTPEQRRAYLQGMIDRIDAVFLPEEKQHQLTIHFVKPIVGDGIDLQKPKKGYRLREGASTQTVKFKAQAPPGKKVTPVGNHSVTVE